MEVDIKCTPITCSAYRAQLLLDQMPDTAEDKPKTDWMEVAALFVEFFVGLWLYALPFLLLLAGWMIEKLFM